MWNEILDILIDKVSKGVEVRFMYDGMCSMVQLPYHYPKTMKNMELNVRCSARSNRFSLHIRITEITGKYV